MKRLLISALIFGSLAIAPMADEISWPHSPTPLWSTSSSPALQSPNEGSPFTQVATVEDSDTYTRASNGTLFEKKNNAIDVQITVRSGTLEGAVNVETGAGRKKKTWTIRANSVNADTIFVDDFSYADGSPEVCVDGENVQTSNNVDVQALP